MPISWDSGYKKVSKKSRNGSGRRKMRPHKGHHKNLPAEYDRERARQRRSTILEARAADLEAEIE